jgi:hypothetical protein
LFSCTTVAAPGKNTITFASNPNVISVPNDWTGTVAGLINAPDPTYVATAYT